MRTLLHKIKSNAASLELAPIQLRDRHTGLMLGAHFDEPVDASGVELGVIGELEILNSDVDALEPLGELVFIAVLGKVPDFHALTDGDTLGVGDFVKVRVKGEDSGAFEGKGGMDGD